MGRVRELEVLVGAVLEVHGVDVEEEVLHVGVRVVTAHLVGQLLHANCHVVVRPGSDGQRLKVNKEQTLKCVREIHPDLSP